MSARHHDRRWRRVALAAKERDGWRCVRCGRMGDLEAHHRDRRPGKFFDLGAVETLCRGCHIAEHRRTPRDPARARWAGLVQELATP